MNNYKTLTLTHFHRQYTAKYTLVVVYMQVVSIKISHIQWVYIENSSSIEVRKCHSYQLVSTNINNITDKNYCNFFFT